MGVGVVCRTDFATWVEGGEEFGRGFETLVGEGEEFGTYCLESHFEKS